LPNNQLIEREKNYKYYIYLNKCKNKMNLKEFREFYKINKLKKIISYKININI